MNKNTPFGKGLRTAYQALGAIASLLAVILAIPELRGAVDGTIPLYMAIVPVVAGLISWYQNHHEDKR